ncbi:MAG: SWIM zinc finger family protein [Bellilinea sp.]
MVDDRNGMNGWGMNPRKARGGIKAQSEHGTFGKHWWARRWISAMEQLVSGPRLIRGQFYARQGQVVSIEETRDGVAALVQGSRPRPYKVTIRLTPLTARQWNRVLDVLADQAIFAAQLLAGEMPSNIEEAFATAGVSLFPQSSYDMISECSCPDKANPCKHVAATHYILGERFDEDPFLLFRMRGRTQEQLLSALRQRRSGASSVATQPRQSRRPTGEEYTRLEDSMHRYWTISPEIQQFSAQVRTPAIPQPLLKRLGEPDFVRDLTLQNQLEDVYNAISQFALLLAYGDALSAPSEEEEES